MQRHDDAATAPVLLQWACADMDWDCSPAMLH